MAKKPQQSFNDVLALLGSQRFDVAPAPEGSPAGSPPTVARPSRALRVSKYGCAAEIAEAAPSKSRPGPVLCSPAPAGCSTARSPISSTGLSEVPQHPPLEIPATADHLRALHSFTEEFNEAAGAISLYNQSLGTTSDSYLYDRVKGRE